MTTAFQLNGQAQRARASGDTPLLWVLRDELGLTGTKFGCGVAQCGACTVHIEGRAVRSCVMPLAAVAGKPVTTIEALEQSRIGRALQDAWIALRVAQCGYCQSGALMAAADLLQQHPVPDDAQIAAALSNLCRCGTYPRMAAAVKAAAQALRA
jgi:isoquinoline 1-oxidoreductase alpha subunit